MKKHSMDDCKVHTVQFNADSFLCQGMIDYLQTVEE